MRPQTWSLAVCALLLGCGGHGAKSSSDVQQNGKTAVRLTINWPKRVAARDIDASADTVEVDVYTVDPKVAAEGGTNDDGSPKGNTLINSVTASRPADGSASTIDIGSVPLQNTRLALLAYDSKDPDNASKPTHILSAGYAPSSNPSKTLTLTPGGSNVVTVSLKTDRYLFRVESSDTTTSIIQTDWSGGNPTTVAESPDGFSYLVAKPNRSSLAYQARTGNENEALVYVVDPLTGNRRAILHLNSDERYSEYGLTGDNQYLYYIRRIVRTGVHNIIRTDWDGQNETILYQDNGAFNYFSDLAVKPDGMKVVSLVARNDNAAVLTVDTHTGSPSTFSSTVGPLEDESGSRQIACDNAFIYRIKKDGDGPSSSANHIVQSDWRGDQEREVYESPNDLLYLAVRTDGQAIAFTELTSSDDNLIVLDVLGGYSPTTLAHSAWEAFPSGS